MHYTDMVYVQASQNKRQIVVCGCEIGRTLIEVFQYAHVAAAVSAQIFTDQQVGYAQRRDSRDSRCQDVSLLLLG